jgi:hypothetical protein
VQLRPCYFAGCAVALVGHDIREQASSSTGCCSRKPEIQLRSCHGRRCAGKSGGRTTSRREARDWSSFRWSMPIHRMAR